MFGYVTICEPELKVKDLKPSKVSIPAALSLTNGKKAIVKTTVSPAGVYAPVKFSSSNTKVATVKIKDNAIWATPQKAGTTTITVKTERETYKCTFTVYKYVNPVSSAKVGKLTIKGTAFKKNAIYNLRYSKYKNKSIAFKFNLKKGWKLRGGISYARSNWGVAKMSPNGSKIKVAGGSGFLAVALAENIKTGQRERIHIYFK